MAPKGPYKLCTVNTAPDRAKRLIGRVVEDVKEEYIIDYAENCESMFVLALFLPISWVDTFLFDFLFSIPRPAKPEADSNNRNRRCQGNG